MLGASLAPLPVKVVIYLRSRGPVIWSQWQEHVKFGEVRGFPDYVANLMLHTPEANMLDPLGLALRCQRALGPVTLVDYDCCVAEGYDITLPLMHLAAGKAVELPRFIAKPVNTRMPQERVEILRLLNLLYLRRRGNPGARVRGAFLAAARDNPAIKAAEAELADLIRPRLVFLPLAMLDRYCESRDQEATAQLEDAGVAVPPFGLRSAVETAEGFQYLPDTAVLFSPIPKAIDALFSQMSL